MKVIITESQLNNSKLKRFEKFVNMLLADTHILNVRKEKTDFISFSRSLDDKIEYVGQIQYPFFDEPKDLKFGGVRSFSFSVPSRFNLKSFLELIGVESNIKSRNDDEKKIWDMYMDGLEKKIMEFIKEYLENEG